MFNNFYGYLAELSTKNTDLFRYISVAKEYDKIYKNPADVFDDNGFFREFREDVDKSQPIFISTCSGEFEVIVAFYENLFMIFTTNDELDDQVVQIFVKRPQDEWAIPVKENGELDLLHPINVKIEVYKNYDVSVENLNYPLSRCKGETYKPGSWNKAFYKTFGSFLKKIENYTEINQINHAYGK